MQHRFIQRKFILCSLVFCVISLTVNAQKIAWERSYGGKHSELLFDPVPTPDYGFNLLNKGTYNTDAQTNNAQDEVKVVKKLVHREAKDHKNLSNSN
jgi:hypothetical protein